MLMRDGSYVVIDSSSLSAIDRFSGKAIELSGRRCGELIQFTSSQLEKTVEFSGGGGSGLGAGQTKINESAQAVYLASKASGKRLDDPSLESRYIIESELEEVLGIPDDWSWSSKLISEHLVDLGIIDRTHVLHHGSEYSKHICDVARALVENEGVRWNKDKWSPADIWAVRREDDLSYSDIGSMNSDLARKIRSGDLIGISLKKVKSKPKAEFCNMGRDRPKFELIRCGNVGSFQSGDFFSSKNCAAEYSGGLVQGRTYQPMKNWCLEIDGKNAKHGKIGRGPVSSLLVTSGHSELPEYSFILDGVNNQLAEFRALFYELYRKNPPSEIMDEKNFFKLIDEKSKSIKGIDWIYSKFIGASFIDSISQDPSALSDIVLYAMSQSSISGPFLKVSD